MTKSNCCLSLSLAAAATAALAQTSVASYTEISSRSLPSSLAID